MSCPRMISLIVAAALLQLEHPAHAQDCSEFVVLDTANNASDESSLKSMYSAVCRDESFFTLIRQRGCYVYGNSDS
jgi:hypothetical protein